MAMNPVSMAESIIEAISGIDVPDAAMNTFYTALCIYVETNAEVFYSWSATNPFAVPDPVTLLECKIKTTGFLVPSGMSTPREALDELSAKLNINASMWKVVWPPEFSISPAFIIPTIHITPSMKDTQLDAWVAVCTQIIEGIKKATPGPLSGEHEEYKIPTPGASFIKIL